MSLSEPVSNSITSNSITSNSITSNSITSNSITSNSITSDSITSDFITLSGTYFYLGSNLPMQLGDAHPFTVECWVGFSSLDSAVPLFSKAGELVFGLTDSGNVFARRCFWENPLVSAQTLEPGTWHHVGLTCDEENWSLYVDGHASAIRRLAETSEIPRNIGTLKRSANLSCEIWNLRVWNVARTREEMLRTMSSMLSAGDGLVASFFPEPPAASELRIGRELEVAVA